MNSTHEDCFAYKKDKRQCSALNQLFCAFEKCPFYKPIKQPPEEVSRRVRHSNY